MTRSHTDKEQLSSMFAFLHTYLKYSGKLNMLDENKVMEDIMCEVLNRIYGWHLVNLNTKEKNYPGIDLGDIQQGLGIQVTADKTSAKIQYTFSKVIAHEVYETYPHIKMMILGEKQSSYTIPELGFMVQLSLKQKEFGTNKICLYQAILDEWLHGSSRENKMLLWETDLSYG
ncbi:MAG: SMEK domain-containing protein, partial [Lachnobacterium sp.]|nr:SMEK domain-containing protein [Lachnobacterium sp.]